MTQLVLVGKLPPPYYGTTVWYEIVMGSDLVKKYNVVFFESGIHSEINSLSKVSSLTVVRNVRNLIKYWHTLSKLERGLCHIPISQSTGGILRDLLYVYISLAMKNKVIIHLHGSRLANVIDASPAAVRYLFRRAAAQISAGVVLSDRFKEIMYSVGISNAFTVRNGADYNVKYDAPRLSNRILYLGNLQTSKGIEDVIHALRIVVDSNVDVSLDVVGSWREKEDEDRIVAFVKRHSLPVVFHGAQYGDKKMRYYEDASLFVFTPREPEGHPWVINEALAAGLPIIATNQGMIPDAVRNDENGYIVETHSPETIASKVIEIFENEPLRRKMGEASRRIYLDLYTESAMLKDFQRMLENVMFIES